MKNKFAVLIVLIQTFLYTSCDTNVEKRNKELDKSTLLVNESDIDQDGANFIKVASLGSIMQVEYAKVAQQKASNPGVKTFAEKMISHHTKIFNDMKKLATEKKILLPITMEQFEADSLTQLQNFSGADFDRNYMKMMVMSHQKSVKTFESGARNRDAAVNRFASSKLDTLKEHLNSAKALFDKINN